MLIQSDSFYIPNYLCYGIPIISLISALNCLYIQSITQIHTLINLVSSIIFIPSGIGLLFGLVVIMMGKPDKLMREKEK